MPLNDPYEAGTVRQPRMKILNNGAEIVGAISFTTHSNSYYQADTFNCEFALSAFSTGLAFWGDPAWDNDNPMLLDIQASLDAGTTWESLIIGQVDHIAIHLEKGIVQVDGRDRTAALIDSKTRETYVNQTSSQVIETLAAKHKLVADVTPTSTLVGRYYQSDYDSIGSNSFTRTTTDWNMACSLAQHEEFDIWVTGNVLHFHPTTSLNPDPYLVVWDKASTFSNAMEITIQRSLTFAKDVVVVLRSFNSQTGRSITAYAPSGARAASIASGKAESFAYLIPNLTDASAQQKANDIRADLTKHERLIEITRPADVTLNARNLIQLTGTGSSWDQIFHIDVVERTMSWDSGFTMHVRGKNVNPVSSVLAS